MRNKLTITKFFDPSEIEDDAKFQKKLQENPQTTFIYGLWIEGAEWDVENQLLIEPKHSLTHQKFPAIEVEPIIDKQNAMQLPFEQMFEALDNPPLTKS